MNNKYPLYKKILRISFYSSQNKYFQSILQIVESDLEACPWRVKSKRPVNFDIIITCYISRRLFCESK